MSLPPEMFQFFVIFTTNFSSPSICEVMEAVYAAIRAGSSASYSMYPVTITSIAKNTAARGVWNKPPNPAAIPVMSMTGVFSFI